MSKLFTLQMEAFERMLDFYSDNTRGLFLDNPQKAYVMATVAWETAYKFTPIEEYGGKAKHYAPFFGRGYVQITWEDNYRRIGRFLSRKGVMSSKYDLVNYPDLALDPHISMNILLYGMIYGLFTGKSLSDCINDTEQDYLNARRIINGMDKAMEIEMIAEQYYLYLTRGGAHA